MFYKARAREIESLKLELVRGRDGLGNEFWDEVVVGVSGGKGKEGVWFRKHVTELKSQKP